MNTFLEDDLDLLNYIVQRNLQVGDTLPSLQDLTHEQHLGLSTGKIREQLAVIRALGLVEVRSKTGTRLREFSFAPAVKLALSYALAREAHAFEQFSELRKHIEVAFWDEACQLLTDADKNTMRQCLDAAQKKLHSHPIRIPFEEHSRFHLAMFNQLQNPFVTGLLEAYWDAYAAVETNRYADYAYLRRVWEFHEQIFARICAGDFVGARLAFIEHTTLRPYHHSPPEDETKGASNGSS
jgi:DNA-binding FadR family transcriptional regulator